MHDRTKEDNPERRGLWIFNPGAVIAVLFLATPFAGCTAQHAQIIAFIPTSNNASEEISLKSSKQNHHYDEERYGEKTEPT